MYGVGGSSPQRRGWLAIIGVIVLVLILAGLFFAFYKLVLQKDESPAPEVTATVLQVVEVATNTAPPPTDTAPAAPPETATLTPVPTVPPTDTPLPSPTLRPPPEAITVGVRARVNIGDGLALNLRDQPALSGNVITQLENEDQVDVVDGPEEVGDLRWWNVNGGEERVGWVVDAFGGDVFLAPVDWSDQAPALPALAPTAAPTLTATLPAPTAAPVVTPTAVPTLAPTTAPEITPTATLVLTPTATPEGGVPSPTVGGRAQVTTKYQFINLRAEAGLGAETVGKLDNGTIVTILEGPEEADGLRWWKVQDGQGNSGWAAERVGAEVLLVPTQ